MYNHICLENIKRLYKFSEKCYDQQQYRNIIEVSVVYIPERSTENSQIPSIQNVTFKNSSAIKPLCHFLYTLEFKPKTFVRRFCAAESNRKETRADIMLWYSIPKRRRN